MSFDAVANGKLDTLLATAPSVPKVSGAGFQVYPDTATQSLITTGLAWVNGSYNQIVASTGQAIYLVGYSIDFLTSGAQYNIDIAVGAAGSEVVISTIAAQSTNAPAALGAPAAYLPALIPVAAGQRLSYRARASVNTCTVGLSLIYVQQANWSGV